MEKHTLKTIFLYLIGVILLFIFGVSILQNRYYILFFGLVLLLFIAIIIVLIRKLDFLEKQNNINLERFTISLEHVNNILFDNVLEADITNDCLIGENAKKLTMLLDIPQNSSYSQTIYIISVKMVEEKFSQEYRQTLSVENILKTLEQGSNTLEYECIERSDGENYRWIRVHYCIYKSNVTNCIKIISYVKNIEEEKRAYNRLLEKATSDQMTGVLNKTATKEIVTNLLNKHSNESSTILMIDIDNFKNINDTYGHDFGDEVIISICNIIKNNFRDTDIVGRMGGDEFLVYLHENLNSENIQVRVDQLLKDVQEFSTEYNQHIINGITISIGIVNTFGNKNFDQLYHYADTAMYKAKSKGKNQYYMYDYTN